MKIRPKEDLNIHLDAENRDEIPGVPLTDDHAIASIEGSNGFTGEQLKTLHIYSVDEVYRHERTTTLCGREMGSHQDQSVLFARGGCGENERQNSYLICNKCIKLCKESKTTEQT